MLLNIGVCDDEKLESDLISNYLTKYSIEIGIDFNVTVFSSGEELLDHYHNSNSPFDIIILDVEMKGITGIETAGRIRKIPDRNVLIMFVTSYPEYMQDSFDVQASQYIVKPISYKYFSGKIDKLLSYYKSLETNIVILTDDGEERVAYLEDIIYIETEKKTNSKSTLKITTVNGDFATKGAIHEFEEKLKDQYFVSVHRSILVNLKYIRRFLDDAVELTTGETLIMSRRKASKIKDDFSKFILMRYRR